jgi:hypothetical protein
MTIKSHTKPHDRHDDDWPDFSEIDFEFFYEEPILEPVVVEPESIPEPVVRAVRYSLVDYMDVITWVFSDGSESELIRFFSDEQHYRGTDFIGKTSRECREVFMRRDGAYLRS